MFEKVQIAPPDPILGLTETFKSDPNPDKINLSVGVYKDATGKTPVLETVKEAERRILEQEDSKGYLAMTGEPLYCTQVQNLLFGEGHEIIASKRAATAQCPGGTGALRVAGDYLHFVHPTAKIWLSNPTWANHNTIFGAAGLECEKYAYRDPETNELTGFRVVGERIEGIKTALMVDDICDGGGTFMGLNLAVKQMYGDMDISLYTTHGIYSHRHGTEDLLFTFNRVFSTTSFHDRQTLIGMGVTPINIHHIEVGS